MNSQKQSAFTKKKMKYPDVAKGIFSIKDFNYEWDILTIILCVKAMRTAQKKFFSTQDKATRQQLLLDAKKKEVMLETLCNQMWMKYDLKETLSLL